MNFKEKIKVINNKDNTYNLSVKINDSNLNVVILNKNELEMLFLEIEKILIEE